MRVTFVPDGGVAAMPGLSRPFTIDTASHPDRIHEGELEELVRAALAERDSQADERTDDDRPPAPHGGDRQTFWITIEDDGEHYELEYLEPVSAPAAAALVERLRALARAAR